MEYILFKSKDIESLLLDKDKLECLSIIDAHIDELRRLRKNYYGNDYEKYILELKYEIHKFIENLNSLSQYFKTNIKRTFGADGFEYIIYTCIPEKIRYIRRSFFVFIAKTYFYMGEKSSKNNFANVLGRVVNSTSMINNFEHLLNCDFDKDSLEYFQRDLNRYVRIIKSKNYNFDIEDLFLDLILWSNKGKQTQIKWAENFYNTLNIDIDVEGEIDYE